MSKVLVRIEARDSQFGRDFIMEKERYDSLIDQLEKNGILFETLEPTDFHWIKKGVEWCIEMFVIDIESFPKDYLKDFEGGNTIIIEDS